jgi:Tfp pilus assembly protein PilF
MVGVAISCNNCGYVSATADKYCRACGTPVPRPRPDDFLASDAVDTLIADRASVDPTPIGALDDRATTNPVPVHRQPSTNGLAIASFVFGILWFSGGLALVFGYIARKQIDRSRGAQKGRGLATAGIVLGWVWVGVTIAAVVVIGLVATLGSQHNPTGGISTGAAAAPRVAPQQAVAATHGTSVADALAKYEAGHVALAKTELQDIVKKDPTNKYGWYNLGVIAQGARDNRSAGTDYLRAIAIDPRYEPALYNYGVLRSKANDLSEAIPYLRRAAAAKPNDANAHWNLGLALVRLKTPAGDKQAKAELNIALGLNPKLINTLETP